MNPYLSRLEPYPFTKLNALYAKITPPAQRHGIALSVGEPQHPAPSFVMDTIAQHLPSLGTYPKTTGSDELRQAIAAWLCRRFALGHIDADAQVLPVNGTREALFSFAQALIDPADDALVLCPNPFYQIYEGAAFLAGAQPVFINCTADTQYRPDFDSVSAQQWRQCQLLYLCSPGNPTGAVLPLEQLQQLIHLAWEHDFVIASDECYSEIYPDESAPPPGLLQACAALGDANYRNCVVFHSLSKRSNLPGLRSGFVAGDAEILRGYLQYRTYHGCAMPLHHQLGSIAAWQDEDHVVNNRQRYREKFAAVLAILQPHLPVEAPQAGFYLWPRTPVADTVFAQCLYREEHLKVLPGSFLARATHTGNPGANRVRMALVATLDDCVEAATRIVRCLEA